MTVPVSNARVAPSALASSCSSFTVQVAWVQAICTVRRTNNLGNVQEVHEEIVILTRQVYIGHMVQGTKRQSFYENRRQYKKPQEEWVIVENTHEPSIDRDTVEKGQEIMRQRNEEYFEKLGRFS